jgi:hypothetical protein
MEYFKKAVIEKEKLRQAGALSDVDGSPKKAITKAPRVTRSVRA